MQKWMTTLPCRLENVYRYDEFYSEMHSQIRSPSMESLKIEYGPLYLENVEFAPKIQNFKNAIRTTTGAFYYNNVYAHYQNGLHSIDELDGPNFDWTIPRIKTIQFSIPFSYEAGRSASIVIDSDDILQIELSTKNETFDFNQGHAHLQIKALTLRVILKNSQTFFSAIQHIKKLAFFLNLRECWRGSPYDINLTTEANNSIEVFFKEDSYTENSNMHFGETWDYFVDNFSQQLCNLEQLFSVFPNKSWWEPTLLTEHSMARKSFTTEAKILEPSKVRSDVAHKKDFAHAFDFFEMVLRAEYIRIGYKKAHSLAMKRLLERYTSTPTSLQSFRSHAEQNSSIKEVFFTALEIRNALHHTFLDKPLEGKNLKAFQDPGWITEIANDIWQAGLFILALDTLHISPNYYDY